MKLLTLLSIFALAAAAFAVDITPEDSGKHIGETVTVRGTVSEVFLSKSNNVYLNFGAAYPNQIFTAAVLKEKTPALLADGVKWLQDFKGKTVVVSGKIELSKGKPAIILTAREDIHLSEDSPANEKKP